MPFRILRSAGWLVPLILLLGFPLPAQSRDQSALEKKLTKRVDQYYSSFVSGDWKTVETLITDSSRDIWKAEWKGTIESFHIESLKIDSDGKRADVIATVKLRVAQISVPLELPQKTEWIYKKRQWFLQLKPPANLMDMFKGTGGPPAISSAP